MGFYCCRRFLFKGDKWSNGCIFLIVIIYFLYILGGAFIIGLIEEDEDNRITLEMRASYREFITNSSKQLNETELRNFLKDVFGSLKNGESIDVLWEKSKQRDNWRLDQSILFAVSILTMIGYGNMTPLTAGGKLFVIFFAICGIPLTLLLLSIFVEQVASLSAKLLDRLNDSSLGRHRAPVSWSIYALLWIIFVLTFFFFIPAAIFHALENRWSYLDSFYFCFVSLTTIGFGDYVPARDFLYSYRSVYIISIALYLMIGLVVLMTMIGEVCKSPWLHSFLTKFSKTDSEQNLNSKADQEGQGADGYQSIGDS